MVRVLATVGDALVTAVDPGDGLAPVVGAFLFAEHRPLELSQMVKFRTQVLVVRIAPPITGVDGMDVQVNADDRAGLRCYLLRHLDGDGNPMVLPSLGECSRKDLSLETELLGQSKGPKLGNRDGSTVHSELVVGYGERARTTLSGTKAGHTVAAPKEGAERGVVVKDGLFQDGLG